MVYTVLTISISENPIVLQYLDFKCIGDQHIELALLIWNSSYVQNVLYNAH